MWLKVYLSFIVLMTIFCNQVVISHTVQGTIINDSNTTFDLSEASTIHGSLKTAPEARLLPYATTGFELESSIFDDRIKFEWAYTPETNWCSSSLTPVTGKYEYLFGYNSCEAPEIVCPTNGNLTVIINNCNGLIGTTNPSYNILISWI